MSSIALCCCGDPVFGGSVEPPPPMDVSLSNVGGGAEVYVDTSGPNPFELRTLVQGVGIGVTQLVSTIEIASTDDCETDPTIAPSVAGYAEVYETGTRTPWMFKPIIGDNYNPAGSPQGCVKVTDFFQYIGVSAVIVNKAADSATVANLLDNASNNYALWAIEQGTGIDVAKGISTITITNTDPASGVTLTSAGGTETLVVDGIGPSISTKGLTAGTGTSLTANATSITITNTDPASSVSLASVGAGASLVQDGVGPAMALRSIVQSTGITVTQNANDVTITNSSPASSVTLTSAGGTVSLVNDGVGPAIANKGLTAGSGASVTDNTTFVTIANTDPGSAVSLSSTGAGASLVQDGIGPGLAVRSLTQGPNITIVQNANDVQISATAVASPGMEVVVNVNASDVSVSTRRITVAGRQCFVTQVYINIAAGTQVCKLRARSVSSGTTTLHNVQMMAQSTLGNSASVSTTAFTTSSTTFVDVTSITATLNAGEWIVCISGDCTPP